MSNEAITRLLVRAQDGEASAVDEVLPLLYDEMRRLANHHMQGERATHTLTPTALVHEAYIRLVDQERVRWQGRGHFLAVASMVMRRLLVNHARDRAREKRGGGARPVTLTSITLPLVEDAAFEMVELDELVARLESFDPRAARVVECRFFGGLSIDETAEALGIAPVTVKRAWLLAKTWLKRELGS
ncbi:MAG: sigma-70 family RNA polymerase sigma factor [bacterium]